MTQQKSAHLARLGMDERHVDALRMPDLADTPLHVMGKPAVEFLQAPIAEAEEYSAEYAPKTLPKALEE